MLAGSVCERLRDFRHDKCAGNVMTIKHTGSIYASYLHIGEFKVKKGDKVKRGQLIADAGKHGNTRCSGNIDHLHFQQLIVKVLMLDSGPTCKEFTL